MKTKKIILIGVFAAISTVLMFFELSLPVFPSFLKLDLSTVVVLISGYVISPVAGVFVALVKDLIHLMFTHTGGIGELADFIVSAVMVFTAAYARKKINNDYSTVIGMLLGIVFATIIALLSNYFLLIPFYEKIMPLQAIIEMSAKAIPAINSKFTLIMYAFLPFNLIKFTLVSVFAYLIYKKSEKTPLFNDAHDK